MLCQFEGCEKRVKITDLSCRCEKTFCKIHKFPENHKCEYDYREPAKRQKRIDELKCVSAKIDKL